MNIFITGATGFLGSHLIKRLSETDHQLTCLVRRNSDTRILQGEKIVKVFGDVRDKDSIVRGMHGCQCLINLANVYSFWEPDPQIFYNVNVEGTLNVMECALETDVRRVVHLSTYGAFGVQEACGFTEENDPSPDQSCKYSESKYLADQLVWELYRSKGLPVTVLYPANILGPGDDKATGRYIRNIVFRRLPVLVLEDHYFTVVHIDDVVQSIIQAVDNEKSIGEKYLIGKHYLTFREFNQIISDVSGVSPPRISLPDQLVIWMAAILTFIADKTGKPPLYDLSTDQVKAMISDARCNGVKAESELGLSYTPLRIIIEEAIKPYSL